MKIYKQEIKDGIAEIVQTSASIAYCMPASISEIHHNCSTAFAEKVKAQSANPKQIDLYYIKSVLVSTGWNKNDDVFNPQDTWAARNTPEDKQFNFMHNENDIIGHITGSYVVTKDGQLIDGEMPEDFDIITEAVLYNSWTNPENSQRMKQIIAEIEEGKWFVSMECLFAGFDYALIDSRGKSQLLQRNEDSAFLTKHLRAYGGTGEYEGYKLGRALKEISFSGKGLVSKPANPRSVILDASKAFSLNDVNIFTNFPKGDDIMSDITNLEEQQVPTEDVAVASKEEEVKVDVVEATETDNDIKLLETTLAEKDEILKSLEANIAEKDAIIIDLRSSLEAKEHEMKKNEEELNMMKKEKKMASRKATLLDAGFDTDEIEESLATYEALDDKTFETIVAAMKKKMGKYSKEEKPMAKEVSAEETITEEDVTEETVAELLDDVSTTEATLVDASDDKDELLATRASVAEWLENNVLRK